MRKFGSAFRTVMFPVSGALLCITFYKPTIRVLNIHEPISFSRSQELNSLVAEYYSLLNHILAKRSIYWRLFYLFILFHYCILSIFFLYEASTGVYFILFIYLLI